MSSAIARNILRMFSACCCSWLWVENSAELGDAVDELGDLGAEALLDVGQAVLGVLRDVVQERRLDRDRVDAELGEDLGRRDRVRDVRLAGRPALALVRLDGEVEGPLDGGEVGRRVVLGDRRLERRAQGLEVGIPVADGGRARGPRRGVAVRAGALAGAAGRVRAGAFAVGAGLAARTA